MYELLSSLLEEDGVDRLDTEDPARMRASAAAKLAEITEVCCADTRILHAKASQVMECHAVFYELTYPAHQLAPYSARFCSISPTREAVLCLRSMAS